MNRLPVCFRFASRPGRLRARRRALAASIPPERRRAYRGRPPETLTDEELDEAIACLEAEVRGQGAAATGQPPPEEAVDPFLRCAACRVLYPGQTIYADPEAAGRDGR